MLEGLCALKKISRTDEGRLSGAPGRADAAAPRASATIEQLMEDDEPTAKGKKKYYN